MKKILLISIIALFALTGCTVSISSLTDGQNTSDDVVFAVIGDNEGVNSTYDALMKKIVADDEIDFIIHVGDIVSDGGKTQIDEIRAHMQEIGFTKPLYVVPGNHDIYEDLERTAFKNGFGDIPQSVAVKNLHIVLLDNADRKVGFTDETLTWLAQDLEQLQGKQIILVYHRPFNYPLANTFGDDETSTSRKSNEQFETILASHDILAIFNGHIHTYFQFPFAVETPGGESKTIPAFVSGGGGQPPQDIFSSLFSADYHYLKVTVTDNGIDTEKISLTQ